ncbi:MAG: GNAT family N-acetyltransferase [Gammaproteobacteria bacterium]
MDHDLRSALEDAGCMRRYDLLYLAHTGAATTVRPAPGPTIEDVTEATLAECEIARIKAFADSEEEPDAAEVAENLISLRLDLQSGNRYLIGRLGPDAAATAGWDEGPDRLVFNLATRVPFRNQGIARHLLSYMIANTYEEGRKSITIFTDPTDSPVQFYRRMGFTEEVYWQARYVYTPTNGMDYFIPLR